MSRVHEREEGYISLYDYIGYDDMAMPTVDTITSTDFPAQDTEKLYEEVRLLYYDEMVHETRSAEFTIIRWDLESPNRVILMCDDPDIIIVSCVDDVEKDGKGTKDDEGNSIANAHVHKRAIQWDELLGVETTNQYLKDENTTKGIILRADKDSDHPQVVMMETDANGYIRFVTGEECRAVMISSEPEAKQYTSVTGALDYMKEYWPSLEEIINASSAISKNA